MILFLLTRFSGKRRKVRCQLSTEKHLAACGGCLQRGIICVSQEADPGKSGQKESSSSPQIDERLERVEALLDKLVGKESESEGRDSDARQLLMTPESGTESMATFRDETAVYETGPVISLFENTVVSKYFGFESSFSIRSRVVRMNMAGLESPFAYFQEP